jgi:DNA-binding winged helix-turn-helix (wHTH) protein
MGIGRFKLTSWVFIICSFITWTNAQEGVNEQIIEVSLRMIGHKVLLASADSTSLVLPITKENNRYKIQFTSEFELKPDELVTTVKRTVKDTGLAKSYIVEVEQCETGELVYSFKMDSDNQSDIIPCRSRILPKSCYNLFFTLIQTEAQDTALLPVNLNSMDTPNVNTNMMYYMIVLILIFSVVLFFFLWKRKQTSAINPNLILLGDYQFDTRNTELLIGQQKIELTSKEAELLFLLYNAVNTTVERDVILNRIWGDEGDYVGRTVDVFISKLRKKLELDSKVKIVNIRGVGYKLVMNV